MLIFLCFISCKKETAKEQHSTKTEHDEFVQIVAKDFKFHMPDTINSGWNNIQFKNEGHAEHFYLFFKVPDTLTFGQYQRDVGKPFQIVLDSLNNGVSIERAVKLLGELIPTYYFTSVSAMGGCGVVSPKLTANNTIYLDPGKYIVECYIKEKGVFHSILGMTKQLMVSENKTETIEPTSNYSIEITNHKYQIKGNLRKGENIIKVNFKEQPEAGLGNDVHLIKLEENTDLNKVMDWLNWMNVEGMQPKAPVQLLGGTQEMPIGHTAYFTIHLEQGNYAWIAENYGALGMVEKFTID